MKGELEMLNENILFRERAVLDICEGCVGKYIFQNVF
jgi:hypothetical protein